MVAKTIRTIHEALASETDECILWPHARTSVGYGHLQHQGRRWTAHRLVLTLHAGPPPDDSLYAFHAAHLCRSRACFNPRHLRWATPAENCADKLRDGTHHRGERCGASKLTEAQVLEIRAATGVHREIAERFGVSRELVGLIKRRKRWGWLPVPDGGGVDSAA